MRRILITNDDGIDAPGIRLLEEVACTLTSEVWVVAPELDQSAVSHSLSLHDPLRVSVKGERKFGVSGTPGDCIVLAIQELMKNERPDLILSGINRGSNLGVETAFSGTVGAAMVGLLLGVSSIALSQVFTKPDLVRWETAAAFAPNVIRQLASIKWPENCCLSVNFPDFPPSGIKGMVFTNQGPGLMEGLDLNKRVDLRNHNYYWLNIRRGSRSNPADSETAVVLEAGISVTPLQFERTNVRALSFFRAKQHLLV